MAETTPDDRSFDLSDVPGYDPATGEIHDDPGLEVPGDALPGALDPSGLLGGLHDEAPGRDTLVHPSAATPPESDWQGEGDPVHGDSFVAEHPEFFGGGETAAGS
jgi:hypothetical protein